VSSKDKNYLKEQDELMDRLRVKKTQMPYKIIRAEYYELLETIVNKNIQKGYKPIGGIAIDKTNGKRFYYQTMIKS